MDLIGQHIGSYVARKLLGSGGAGAVYLCEHTLIERQVAVKVLHEDLAADADEVARFLQEAKAAAAIGHPNIISIIDAGYLDTPGGKRAFMMMEALDGQSLDKALRKGGFDLEQIRHILEQCASALMASHGKGIIHRDLKPANVFLCKQIFDPLFVKILDFGIAKLVTPGSNMRKTQVGIVLGTPHYMSPEQCEGKGAIDHRSDIYSLGVMLFEMLTGTLPFDGEVGTILIKHITDDVPAPSSRNPKVPPEWDALCLRMCERPKEERPQSMAEVALALQDLRRHAEIYAANKQRRGATGHSGHTQILTAPVGVSGDGVPGPIVDAGSRPTLRGSLDELTGGVRIPTGGYVTPPGAYPTPAGGSAAPSGSYTPAGGSAVPSGPYTPAGGSAVPPGAYPTPAGGSAAPSGGFAAPPQVVTSAGDTASLVAHCTALATAPDFRRMIELLLGQPRGHWIDLQALCRYAHVPAPATHLEIAVAWLDHPRGDAAMASVTFFAPEAHWSTTVPIQLPARVA